jgi:hypothetical protein
VKASARKAPPNNRAVGTVRAMPALRFYAELNVKLVHRI